jgi:hypothetical protein
VLKGKLEPKVVCNALNFTKLRQEDYLGEVDNNSEAFQAARSDEAFVPMGFAIIVTGREVSMLKFLQNNHSRVLLHRQSYKQYSPML